MPTLAYWRIIKTDGFLIKTYNMQGCTLALNDEGFETIAKKSGGIKLNYKDSQLYGF